ncbi:hypothetical protein [Cellulosimicrobium sp. NPDC057862]|uniref:hypothetical protein n=1 Tax=Actinomycetes TaxID=1760 RepID=UPI0036725A06
MRKPAKIHHPGLEQEVTVDERAVPIWERSGWKPGPLPEPGADQPTSDGEPGEEPAPDEPPAETAPKAARAGKPKTPAAPPATPDA